VDYYANVPPLNACVADATAVAQLLSEHCDGKPNYECKLLTAVDQSSAVVRSKLRASLTELFQEFSGEVLFFFSGHGAILPTGGVLATSDAELDDLGVSMGELVNMANSSKASDVLLIIDCCHAGDLGNSPGMVSTNGSVFASLREGVTVLAAAKNSQAAIEAGGHGLFTAALIDALDGGAADHMGWVTAPSIFSYIERRFGAWGQRPVFKMHADSLAVVRECAPLIDRYKLRLLVTYFPTLDFKLSLDPEYEPEDEFGNTPDQVNTQKVELAALLKDFRDAGLVTASVPGEQFFWAARRSHNIELTARGREYWQLVRGGRI
jgi:hypothetical protein